MVSRRYRGTLQTKVASSCCWCCCGRSMRESSVEWPPRFRSAWKSSWTSRQSHAATRANQDIDSVSPIRVAYTHRSVTQGFILLMQRGTRLARPIDNLACQPKKVLPAMGLDHFPFLAAFISAYNDGLMPFFLHFLISSGVNPLISWELAVHVLLDRELPVSE